MNKHHHILPRAQSAEDYATLDLHWWSFKDLSDALTCKRTAELLGVSLSYVYTVRQTDSVGPNRMYVLQAAVAADEEYYRRRIMRIRARQEALRAKRDATSSS